MRAGTRIGTIGFVIALVASACGGDEATTTTGATVSTTAPATTTSAPGEGTWLDGLEPGECFDDVFIKDGGFDFTVPPDVVSCDGPHDNQAVALPALADRPFPGDDALLDEIQPLCDEAYEGFLGRAPTDEDPLSRWIVWPGLEDWEAGTRRGLCGIYAAEPLVGTAQSGALKAPGELLAVVHEVDGNTDVWVVDGGTGELLLNVSDTELLAQFTQPGWAADGSVLVYAAGPDDVDRTLFAAGQTIVNPVLLEGVFSAGTPKGNPAIRTILAYIAAPDGEFDIYVADAAAETTTRITDNPDRDTSPSWSPDGTRIAFRGRVDGNSDIYIINADGTGLTRITTDPAFDGDPQWSPDGEKILFTSDRSGDYEIWVMDADGSNPQNLTNHPAGDEYPTWSSDGSLIAFHSDRYSGTSLWLMRADGSIQSLLSTSTPTGYPSFSPVPDAFLD